MSRVSLPTSPDDVERLIGAEIRSEVAPGTVYRLSSVAGEGAMSVAYYGMRIASEGECPVVVKVLRPQLVRARGSTARLLVLKEAVALGRLNERVPPTPYVVRLVDTGSMPLDVGGTEVLVPWIALEYVHGGSEGTTLSQRVMHSIKSTSHAFDAHRAASLVEALGGGLGAVHEVGVIHRDIKPDNVLCCGFGDEEIFKIADFGVARPAGLAQTFGGLVVGTLGYAAPELAAMDDKAIGPWSDVFAMASVIYFVLTGQDYFDVSTPSEAIVASAALKRRSIADSPWLSPDIRKHPAAIRAIDFALGCASSARIEVRPSRADALAHMISPWLRSLDARPSVVAARRATLEDEASDVTSLVRWNWTTLRHPGTFDRVVRDVSWDGDGRCMAATNEGLAFWTGSTWVDVPLASSLDPHRIRFVRRAGPGQWLVGGDEMTFALYSPEGPREVRKFPTNGLRFEMLSGDLDDLCVLVGSRPGDGPYLCCLSARRWLKPVPLEGVAAVTSLTRMSDARWLVTGRGSDGEAYAAIYSPLDWEVRRVETPRVRAILASAGRPGKDLGLAVGANGSVVWTRPHGSLQETIPGGHDLSCAAIDPAGRGLTAAAGRIWIHQRRAAALDAIQPPAGRWELLWSDPAWKAPFVALFTEPGLIVGMTADGGIIEGRASSKGITPSAPPSRPTSGIDAPTSIPEGAASSGIGPSSGIGSFSGVGPRSGAGPLSSAGPPSGVGPLSALPSSSASWSAEGGPGIPLSSRSSVDPSSKLPGSGSS